MREKDPPPALAMAADVPFYMKPETFASKAAARAAYHAWVNELRSDPFRMRATVRNGSRGK